MSLRDLGKNDISEETQALKDKLASRETENAGLRTQLMRRDAELEELRASFNEAVYKLNKEAERALQLEGDVSARSAELKMERMSLRNSELALQSTQEKLKTEERARKELESTLDTVSLHSQTTATEHQAVQREKRALESRVRELQQIVQNHEAKASTSNIPRPVGRPRSSSVSSFRLPAMEQELNETKAQLVTKEKDLHTLQQKLAQAQADLVKAENVRRSAEKASQKRISELLSSLEQKEEDIEALGETENGGEREEELLKRIDEDAAKIAALEKLAAESHATRMTQATVNKLQSQVKAEGEKLRRSEEHRNNLLRENEELARRCEASETEIAESRERLKASEREIKQLQARHAELQAELDTLSTQGGRHSPQSPDAMVIDHPDQSALADHIQTLLQAIDRLRNERDELKRALEFSEVEYRITTEGVQARFASLTAQLSERAHEAETTTQVTDLRGLEARMQRLASCAATFTIVISNLQSRLELSEANLSAASADLASSNSQSRNALVLIDDQKQLLAVNEQERDNLLRQLDSISKESSQSDEERTRSASEVADLLGQVDSLVEDIRASEAGRQEAHGRLLVTEERFAALDKSYQDLESERNSLALHVTNLQNDLDRAQDGLSDVQERYSALQAQQLSDMSASEAVQTLKNRIQDLETRAFHRTQEISDYQHDIRRLETNVKLEEERIAELTSELELLASQKDAMVEDCAEARGARDEAIQKLEAAEEEVERLEEQLRQAQRNSEVKLDSTSRLAELEAANSEYIRELDSLRHDRQHPNNHLNAAAHHSQSLEVENSKQSAELREVVVSLVIVSQACNHSIRKLQQSYQHAASLKSRLLLLEQDLERKNALINDADEETHKLHQQLADISAASELSSSRTAEQHRTQVDALQQQLATSDQKTRLLEDQLSELTLQLQDVDSLHSSLRTKEEELAAAKSQLEESRARRAEAEAELQERIAAMSKELEERMGAEELTDTQSGQSEETARLLEELEDVRARLHAKQKIFTELENRHQDAVQEFAAAREDLENRLAETEQQLRALHTDHIANMITLEAECKQEADLLASNLEDREQEVDELRQQLQEVSEAHVRAQGEFREGLKSHEGRHAVANDLEKELRQTIADMHEQLAQAEALQEERQSLQTQITSLESEIQRSASLTRYLENQVRDSEDACLALKERLQQSQMSLAESEKAGKAAEFNLTLQATQHEKVVTALRREVASLQSGPELRSALADLEERNREMDDLLGVKTQEIEEYDDRILETLKANKKLTSKVESLTRKVQALQAKLASMKSQSQEQPELAPPPKRASSSAPISPIQHAPTLTVMNSGESSRPSPSLRSKTPEPQPQPTFTLPSSHTPGRTSEPSGLEMSAGRKRPAPDDDEREGVPPEGYYPTDMALRSVPTPRLRRAHGHPAGFTPVRGASARKAGQSPGRRGNTGVTPSEIIIDVTNNPRGAGAQGDGQGKKRSWLGKIKGGTGSQQTGARPGGVGQ